MEKNLDMENTQLKISSEISYADPRISEMEVQCM
jgi:hypothetical protein